MKLAIIGYGKMGRAIEQIALQKGHTVDVIISENDPIEKLLEKDIDLAIEFTQPESAYSNITFCLKNNLPIISGTTGWLEKLEEVKATCAAQEGTFLYASNFSIGVNLFFELNKWLAGKMQSLGFVPAMEEIHHTEKKDSPSGTALTLAEGVQENYPHITGWINQKSTDHNQLGIVSVREPNVPGTHTVSYASPLESIDIKHTAHDRAVFAEGVVRVSEWIHPKKGFYTMSDFINTK